MNKEIAEQWAAELESGKYTQGKMHLRSGDRFCCLGVLCEMAIAKGVLLPPSERDGVWQYGADNDIAVLPDEVAAWAGTSSSNPDIGKIFLWQFNDDKALPFPEIAALIRKHAEEL